MDSRITRLSALFVVISIAVFLRLALAARVPASPTSGGSASVGFIKSSCEVTRYPDVCVASLSPYLGSLRPTQSDLVKVAVNVSLLAARDDSAWALTLSKTMSPRKIDRQALNDCIANFGDTSDQIRRSVAELKHLRSDTFKFQMSNVQTWMSAGLTNEDTCLDGFQKVSGSLKPLISRRVQKSCKLISNALALVNKLAASRGY